MRHNELGLPIAVTAGIYKCLISRLSGWHQTEFNSRIAAMDYAGRRSSLRIMVIMFNKPFSMPSTVLKKAVVHVTANMEPIFVCTRLTYFRINHFWSKTSDYRGFFKGGLHSNVP